MKKRIWISALVVVALVVLIAVRLSLYPTAQVEQGSCGDNLTWKYSDGTLTVSGNGLMNDYSVLDTAPWYTYRDSIKSITIEDGVTSVGSYAFYGCNTATTLIIGRDVKTIGSNAFYIGTRLTNIHFNAVNCADFGEDNHVFTNAGIYKGGVAITVGAGVTRIPANLFNPYHGDYSPYILSVSFEDGSQCASIGDYAFAHCVGMTEFTVPAGVTTIGKNPFAYCEGLMSLTVASGNSSYISVNNCLISLESKTLITGCKNSVIPDDGSVTIIAEDAFRGCEGLNELVVPAVIKEIGLHAFADCADLKLVTVSSPDVLAALQKANDCGSLIKNAITVLVPVMDTPATSYIQTAFPTAQDVHRGGVLYHTFSKHEHTWTANGTTGHICPECGLTVDHEIVIDPAKEATCEETGLTEGSHCSICGEVIVAQQVIPAKGHTVVIDPAKAPTCTEPGLTEGSHCSVCGEVIVAQQVIPALGHNYSDEWTIDVEPTCTESGSKSHHCAHCGDKKDVTEIPALGHSFSTEWTIDVAPTCTTPGSKSHHCTVCGEKTDITEIPALGHTIVIDPAKAPTCTETGLTEGSHCSVCGEVIKAQTVIPAKGHSYENGSIFCSDCGHINGTKSDRVLFTLDGSAYIISGSAITETTKLEIPETYLGLPIVSVANGAFSSGSIKEIAFLSRTVTLGANALPNGCLVRGYAGSTAEAYAKANGLTFFAFIETTVDPAQGSTSTTVDIGSIDSSNEEIVIDATVDTDVAIKKSLVTILPSAADVLKQKSLTIKTNMGIFHFDAIAATKIANAIAASGAPLQLSIGDITADSDWAYNTKALSITLTVNGNEVFPREESASNGLTTITVSYLSGLKKGATTVYFRNSKGEKESLSVSSYEQATGYVTFETTHFSRFEILNTNTITDGNIEFHHSCAFENTISLNYLIPVSQLAGYDRFSLHIAKDMYINGKLVTSTFVIEGKIYDKNNDYYIFVFDNIACMEIGNNIRVTLFAMKDGQTYISKDDNYSIRTYCYNTLAKTSDSNLKTLLVDMLNYCAAAQIYGNYRTDALVNADLTPEQLAYGSDTYKPLNGAKNPEILPGATASIVGKTLILSNGIQYKFVISLPGYTDLDGIALRVSFVNINGDSVTRQLGKYHFNYDEATGTYYVLFSDISIMELRTDLSLTVVKDGEAISDTVHYSAEVYAYNKINSSTDENLKNLLDKLMKYSDSTNKYYLDKLNKESEG